MTSFPDTNLLFFVETCRYTAGMKLNRIFDEVLAQRKGGKRIPPNIVRYCPILSDTAQYYPIQSNTARHRPILSDKSNIVRYRPLLFDTVQYCPILSDALRYRLILTHAAGYDPILSDTSVPWTNPHLKILMKRRHRCQSGRFNVRICPPSALGKIARKAQPATAQREVRGAAMLRRTWRTGSTQPPRRAYRGAQRGQAHRRLNPLAEEDSIVESFGPTRESHERLSPQPPTVSSAEPLHERHLTGRRTSCVALCRLGGFVALERVRRDPTVGLAYRRLKPPSVEDSIVESSGLATTTLSRTDDERTLV
ncbi:unnamed protein product [Nesidiocoris tenuis]|uniref:Uncharacterized protein n=1 Tax=Nesidiocoris tenuis TaxID=355587 RepID=A0A6H5FVU0_9HEMI|nr:unnamed protein product [Nesidiocoris tenuis]